MQVNYVLYCGELVHSPGQPGHSTDVRIMYVGTRSLVLRGGFLAAYVLTYLASTHPRCASEWPACRRGSSTRAGPAANPIECFSD